MLKLKECFQQIYTIMGFTDVLAVHQLMANTHIIVFIIIFMNIIDTYILMFMYTTCAHN